MYIPDKISALPKSGLRLITFSAFLLITFLKSQQLFAQFADDFTDGDLRTNPSWNGSGADFIVNPSSQLQLNNSVAGTSYLSTAFPPLAIDHCEWEFYVKQSFASSGGNFGRFYLISDQADLSSPLNGYYLQFGETGSNDAVTLFRQSGMASVSVCRATAAGIAAPFEIRVKVIRSHPGLWQLYIDYSGGTDFVPEASATDATHTTSAYFGILCTYTITNSTRFYYDDIAIRSVILPDTSPPEITSLEVVSDHELRTAFSESLDVETAQDVGNYSSVPFGNPASAVLQEDRKTVQLLFSTPFTNGVGATLAVKDVQDAAGNKMILKEMAFLYFKPAPLHFKDVIITEFCPDPSPPVGMPEAEFVEIFNRSSNPVDLANWSLTDETVSGKLPSFILLPGQYLVLTSANASAGFGALGQTLSVSPFPSLNNSEDSIAIKDANGSVIDFVRYALSWYHHEEKAGGGWSLELIDPENTCAEAGNWVEAEAETGGTPAKQNSVHANKPDNTGPKLLSAIPIDPVTLSLTFDEKLEPASPRVDLFTIDPPLGIHAVSFTDASLTSLKVSLLQEIQASKKYLLTLRDIYDCPGNKIQDAFSQAAFILPEKAIPRDIIINEILFNPRPTGVDFVEVYNRSSKTINLQNWSVGNFNDSLEHPEMISDKSILIHPNEYRVFTEDVNVLKGEYLMSIEAVFIEMDLPAFNDDAGSVAIVDERGTLIDALRYTEEMHAIFLKDNEGVSLERISLNGRAGETQNWRSASSTAGFATPGYLNSNARGDGLLPDDESVIVEPEIFQPLVSSQNFTQIKYHFDRGGFVANVKIFDPEGRVVRELAHNELLGTEGFFRWDGDRDNGSMARMGYYMVWFEIFNAEGMLKTYKKRVAVY